MTYRLRAFALLLLTAAVLSSVSVFPQVTTSASADSGYSRQLLNRYYAMTAPRDASAGIPKRGENNMTMLLLEARKNISRLTPEALSVLAAPMARPTGLNLSYLETTKNFFKIYYTRTGSNAVSGTDNNANGVPDYVEAVAAAFVTTLNYYDSIGCNRPPLVAADNGRFCVYLSNSDAGAGVYGYCEPETNVGNNPLTPLQEVSSTTSFMVLRNNYAGFGSTAAEQQIAMEVTAAHEYFHAVQFGYEYDNMEGYLMEMASTWAEDKVFPGDDDNWQYLPDIFSTPDVSLDWDEYLDGDPINYSSPYSMHWYAAWIFMRYLSDSYGSDIPRLIFEKNITASTSGAINNVLLAKGSSYTTAIKDYYTALALLTQSQTTPMSRYRFQRANDYRTLTRNSGGAPAGPFVVTYDNTLTYNNARVTWSSTASGNRRLMRAGADYIKIVSASNFSVSVTPKTASTYFYARLLKTDSYTNPTKLAVVEPSVNGSTQTFNVADRSTYATFVLVVYNTRYSSTSRDTSSIQYDIAVDQAALANGVNILSPAGGEQWQYGTQHAITWQSANVTAVRLEFTTNNGTNWNLIEASVPAASGSYLWTVPAPAAAACKVRVSDTANAASASVTPGTFAIIQPLPFSIISPNGGEQWVAGSVQSVTWNPNTVGSVKIEYSTNGGEAWLVVAAAAPAAPGAYLWTVPNTVSTNCKVRVSDAANAATVSVTAGVFTIAAQPQTTTVLTENFSRVTAGSIGTPGTVDLSTGLDTYTLTPGWSGAKIYAAGGVIKLGSASAQGYITTPALNLSGAGGNGAITFDLQAFNADTQPIQVFLSTDGGATFPLQLGGDIPVTTSMISKTVTFSGGNAGAKIKITAKGTSNNRFFLDNIAVVTGNVTSVGGSGNSAAPAGYELAQNYPNPFNPSTTVAFTLPRAGYASVRVLNQLGQQVAVIAEGNFSSGTHHAVWFASGQPSGIYYCEFTSGTFRAVKKLMLVK